jgi:hypothetical protein
MPVVTFNLAVQKWPKSARALNEAAASLQPEYGGKIPVERLKRVAERIASYERGSIGPSDYCYNFINKASYSFKFPILERVDSATYKYLGPGFKYTGRVMWQPKDGDEQQVGSWNAGVCTLEKDPRNTQELALPAVPVYPDEIVGVEKFIEGACRMVTVNAYERDQEARRRCIAAHKPRCCACGLDFGAMYGPEFDGFIHVHHLCPLSEIGGEYEVDPVKDLRPVCPNCHAVIHHGGRLRSIEEVRQLLALQRQAEPHAAPDPAT